MREGGSGAAGHDGCEVASLHRQQRNRGERVHGAIDAVQPPGPRPLAHGRVPDPKRDQLSERGNPFLTRHQDGDLHI